MAYPAGNCDQTGPCQLVLPHGIDMDKELLTEVVPIPSGEPIAPMPAHSDRDCFEHPIRQGDNRLIVWEVKRPNLDPLPILPNIEAAAIERAHMQLREGVKPDESDPVLKRARWFCIAELCNAMQPVQSHMDSLAEKMIPSLRDWLSNLDTVTLVTIYNNVSCQLVDRNGYIVPTNDVIHNCTGSATNALLLGNVLQSRASLFYVAPYLCKNKTALEACLVALEHAQRRVAQHPSRAEDTGTDKRTVQHMFTQVINNLSRSIQLSDTQVALALLGMGTEIATDSFCYFGANFAVNVFLHNLFLGPLDGQLDTNSSTSSGSDTDDQDCIGPEVPDEDNSVSSSATSESVSSCDNDETSLDAPDNQLEKALREWSHELDLDTSQDWHNEGADIPDLLRKSYGPAPIYTVYDDNDEKVPTPVHYPTHWWFRGKSLRHLTMFEYYSIVDIIRRPKPSDNDACDECRPGKKKRQTFDFHEDHPLHESHVQALRFKQHTLILNAHPPKDPGPKPRKCKPNSASAVRAEIEVASKTWTRKANAFARFYNIVFLPHDNMFGDDNAMTIKNKKHMLTWKHFCQRVHEFERSHRLIDRLRLAAMSSFQNGLRAHSQAAKFLSNYRHRCSTRWSDEEKKQSDIIAKAIGLSTNATKFPFLDDEDDNVPLVALDFKPQERINAVKALRFQQSQCKALSDIHANTSTIVKSMASESFKWNPLQTGQQTIDFKTTADEIMKAEFDRFGNDSKPNAVIHSMPGSSHSFSDIKSHIKDLGLSPSQQKVVNKFNGYFTRVVQHQKKHGKSVLNFSDLHHANIKPPQHLLTGDPGSGKSYTIDSICKLVTMHGLGHVVTTSFNGIAAVNIDGSTISSMFKIYDSETETTTKPLDDQTILQLRTQLQTDRMAMLIVDEVSTIDARIIAVLDLRLRQLMDIDLPFGGVPTLFGGDFNQLGPVRKIFLPNDMMGWAVRLSYFDRQNTPMELDEPDPADVSPSRKLTKMQIDANLKRIRNARSEHQVHKKLEEIATRFKVGTLAYRGCFLFANLKKFHLKEQQRSEDPEHNAFIQQLSKGERMKLKTILSYKPLSKQDIDDDPEWIFAPTLVVGNHERITINRHKAKLWAIRHKTHVFKWKCVVRKERNPPSPHVTHAVQHKHAFFWQYFVKGAGAYLNCGINNDLALVNGTPVELHSLTFSEFEERQRIADKIAMTPFGEEIEVMLPDAVNVKVLPALDGKQLSTMRQNQMDELSAFSIVENEVVIPITTSMNRNDKTNSYRYFISETDASSLAMAEIREPFPFDLGFSTTIHKAQGRTIHRIVIDLTWHPISALRMQYASALVALTRVKRKCDLRRVCHDPRRDKADHDYLTKLQPPMCLQSYHAGYQTNPNPNEGSTWSPTKALAKQEALLKAKVSKS